MKTNLKYLVVFILVLSILAVCAILMLNINIRVNENELKIDGIYGKSIAINAIQKIELLNDFPILGARINGINMIIMNIGVFNYSDFGIISLYEISREKPYLYIITKNERYVLAFGKNKNLELYEKLTKIMKDNAVLIE